LSLIVEKYVKINFQEQRRYFFLKGQTLTWQEHPGTSGAVDKSSCLEIGMGTLVYVVDGPSDRFEFEIANFTPIKCGHAADKPYRLGAASSDERDMWVSTRFRTCMFFSSTALSDAPNSIIFVAGPAPPDVPTTKSADQSAPGCPSHGCRHGGNVQRSGERRQSFIKCWHLGASWSRCRFYQRCYRRQRCKSQRIVRSL
jgi:hypothetical protein